MEKAAKQNKSAVLEVVKTVIVAVIISLVAILLMAFLIKLFNISTAAIPIINQVIKGVSILAACLICIRTPSNGWIKGIVSGLLYIALAFVIFSLLNGQFKFGLNILNDVAIGSVSGMISGIIAVSIRK